MNLWRISRQVWELKTSGGSQSWGAFIFLWVLPKRALPGSHSEDWGKPLLLFSEGGKKRLFWKYPEHSVLNKACPQKELFYQHLNFWGLSEPKQPGRREISNSSSLEPSCPLYGAESWGRLRSTCEVHSPCTRVHWDLITGLQNAIPPPQH